VEKKKRAETNIIRSEKVSQPLVCRTSGINTTIVTTVETGKRLLHLLTALHLSLVLLLLLHQLLEARKIDQLVSKFLQILICERTRFPESKFDGFEIQQKRHNKLKTKRDILVG
jgi:hypothetical protein